MGKAGGAHDTTPTAMMTRGQASSRITATQHQQGRTSWAMSGIASVMRIKHVVDPARHEAGQKRRSELRGQLPIAVSRRTISNEMREP